MMDRYVTAYSCGGSRGLGEYPRTAFPFHLLAEAPMTAHRKHSTGRRATARTGNQTGGQLRSVMSAIPRNCWWLAPPAAWTAMPCSIADI